MTAENPAAAGSTSPLPPGTPLRKAPLFTAREVWWSMFAALALAYLGVRALAPDWLEDLTPANGAIAEPGDIQAQRMAQRLSGEVRNLQTSVAQLQMDMAKVKTDIAGEAEQSRALGSKISALEQKTVAALQRIEAAARAADVPAAQSAASASQAVGMLEPASVEIQNPKPVTVANPPQLTASPPPKASFDAAAIIAAAAPTEAATIPTAQLAPPPPAQHKIINAATAPVPVKTVSPAAAKPVAVAQPPKAADAASASDQAEISFGPPVVKRASKAIGLQISSSTSVDSLRQSWANLSQNHSAELQSMQPLYLAKGPATNQTFDLVAGPVKSKAEAIKLCKDLVAKNVACKVGAFEGSAF